MAISKLILNGDVQMDVTSNTNAANNMLNGVIGTKNDGTSITGNIATKSSADLTASGSVVTAPAGYYATSATKSVTEGSAFPPAVTITKNPTFSINSSTAVVTASYAGSSSITPTVSSGYISQGTAGTIYTTGTSTYTLTSKAAATIYPSTADQTISSYRWLTGTQTIKSVTTTNLTASNIAEGVVVKVGDSTNASRITQITGTHSGVSTYTATITGTGTANTCYVSYNNIKYYSAGTFQFIPGNNLYVYLNTPYDSNRKIYLNGLPVGNQSGEVISYNMTLQSYDTIITLGVPIYITTPTISITSSGFYDVTNYANANVDIADSSAQIIRWIEV